MKQCTKCSVDCGDDQATCPLCGGELTDKCECAVCGKPLKPGSKFCSNCGAIANGSICTCKNCGCLIDMSDAYCPNCGAKVSVGNLSSEKKKSSTVELRDKIVAFEKNHRVVANLIVMVLAIVVIFVSLFTPIKITISNLSQSISGIEGVDMDKLSVNQSISQVFSAWEYTNFDPSTPDGKKEFEQFSGDLSKCLENITKEYTRWLKLHPNSSDDAQAQKALDLILNGLSEINLFSVMLMVAAATKQTAEVSSGEAAYAQVVVSMYFATIEIVLRFALAIMSLVFFVFAVVDIVRKKKSKAEVFMRCVIILSGIALLLMSVAPVLVSLDGVFAVCLTASLAYFMYGLVGAIMSGKSTLCIVKRGVCAAVAIAAFFLLCGYILNYQAIIVDKKGNFEELSSTTPFGTVSMAALNIAILDLQGGYFVEYSGLSVAATIISLIMFTVGIAVMLAAMIIELNTLTRHTERKDRVRVLPIVGAGVLAVASILSGALSAAAEPPMIVEWSYVVYKFFANAQVYVSLGLTAASILFGVLFVPSAKKARINPPA